MRLIDADALKEKLLKERDAIPLTYTERYGFGIEFPSTHGQARRGGVKVALRCMEQTPTIDAVPVIRCSKCKRWDNGKCKKFSFPPLAYRYTKEYDFCSRGERNEG